MGMKLKDTLLRLYAEGVIFDKPVEFLLIINLEMLEFAERVSLYERFIDTREFGVNRDKVRGYIPTGLKRFDSFRYGISFEMPKLTELKARYGFDVTAAN
jgi:hypothetical protein